MSEPELSAVKHGAIIQIPVEVLRDIAGMREPTAEETAEAERRCTERAETLVAFQQALAAVADPLPRKLLDLHCRTEHAECGGCDPGMYAESGADWPCSTVETIAPHYGIKGAVTSRIQILVVVAALLVTYAGIEVWWLLGR